jgi:iron complex transport system permease protein
MKAVMLASTALDRRHRVVLVAGLAALSLVLLLAGLAVGSEGWSPAALMHTLSGPDAGLIVGQIRAPRTLGAWLTGALLGLAGATAQGLFRNPLADPYLLGVSSGASLLSLLWYVGVLSTVAIPLQAAGQQAFAFMGALASIAVVFIVASRRGRIEPVTLILVGVIVNAVNGSIYLLIYFRHPEIVDRGGVFTFLVGGIQTNLTRQQEVLAAICVAAGYFLLQYLTGQLNVASLGEAEAEAMGVRIQRLRWAGLVIASIITASVVAISGPIGFVGLICPHLARLITGQDQRRLLPAAAALGAALLAVADAGSRSLFHTQMPVGVLTGLLGGPFFLLLLWRSRRANGGS